MEGYIAQIIMFGGNFSPANWAFCQGQLMSIAENTALFALLGTTYGGDGQTTYALPDFRGRIPVGAGSNSLGTFTIGEMAGTPNTTLNIPQMPSHTHTVSPAIGGIQASGANPSSSNPNNNAFATANSNYYAPANTVSGSLGGATGVVSVAGASQPFNNTMPYLGMHYVICLFGIFPSRN